MPPAPKKAPAKAPAKAAPKKASASALAQFEEKFAKTFGDGALDTGTGKVKDYEVISTGILSLDYEVGVGGLVEGRLVEYWGPDGIGKTRAAILAMVEAQRKHPSKRVAFIDVEQKFDRKWAQDHGLDLKRMYLFAPSNAEDVADAVKEFVRSGLISMIVVDSIGAMIPEAEKTKDADAAVMAQQAKIVTRMVKIAASEAPKTSTAIILINQVRANLSYGADTTTSGGFALKHVTTMKMKFKRTGTEAFKAKVNGQDVVVGHEIAIVVERNGVAPAYRTATASMFNVPTEKYGPIGVDQADQAVTMGIRTGVIRQGGAWYDLPTGQHLQGRAAVLDTLRTDTDALEAVRIRVLDIAAGKAYAEEQTPEDIPEVDPEEGISPRFRTVGDVAEAVRPRPMEAEADTVTVPEGQVNEATGEMAS